MTLADLATVLGGLVAGVLSGALGIGGGLAFVPILTIGFRVAQTVAQGTSLAAIVPTAIVGGVTHLRVGNAQIQTAAWVGGGGVIGAVAGALIAVHVENGLLGRAFGVFFIGVAILMLQRASSPTGDSQTRPASSEPPAAGPAS